MEVDLTANQIKDLTNFLFWNDDETMLSAYVGITVWKKRKSKFGEGFIGVYYPPSNTRIDTPVPFLVSKTETAVNLDLHILCNGVQTINIKDLSLEEKPPIMNDLLTIAINQAKGDIKEEIAAITGYIEKQFSNQTEKSTYRVSQTGTFFTIHKGVKKGNKMVWNEWSNNSPKSKAIIKQFKEAIKNNTLQTEFTN